MCLKVKYGYITPEKGQEKKHGLQLVKSDFTMYPGWKSVSSLSDEMTADAGIQSGGPPIPTSLILMQSLVTPPHK